MSRLSLIKWPGSGGGSGSGVTAVTADSGVSVQAGVIVLGQLLGAVGNPGKLLQSTEIPFNGQPLIFSQIGGESSSSPLSFPIFKKGTSSLYNTPVFQAQDHTGAELFSVRSGGTDSLFIGAGAGALTANAGNRSVGIGTNALGSANASSFENVAIGFNCLSDGLAGIQNTAVGSGALQQSIDGGQNAAFGWNSLNNLLHGSGNLGIGIFALVGVISGNNNTGLGSGVGQTSDESNNVFIGANVCSQVAFGSNNTLIGSFSSEDSVIGSNNIFIGANTQLGAIGGDVSGTTIIGVNNFTVLSNVALFGTSSQNTLIGFTGPTTNSGARLQVNGTLQSTAPLTTAAKVRFGTEVAASITTNLSRYLEIEYDGVVYKLVTAN